MKAIPLTQGKLSVVDDRDYESWLLIFNWLAARDKGTTYARRHSSRDKEGKSITIQMHRLIWQHHNGPIPKGMQIDHINGDGLDNRLENLRLCTNMQNHWNRHRSIEHSSKYKGVHWDKVNRRWRVTIGYMNKNISVGHFDSEEEAARAYDAKAKELFGKNAYPNFA